MGVMPLLPRKELIRKDILNLPTEDVERLLTEAKKRKRAKKAVEALIAWNSDDVDISGSDDNAVRTKQYRKRDRSNSPDALISDFKIPMYKGLLGAELTNFLL
jgi:hypothetical protein